MDPKLKACFCLQISGPSGSGKTVWVKKFLENLPQMINRKVDQIIYCYGEYQPIFDEIRQNMSDIQFYEGFPDVKGITDPSFHTLMIIDDLQNELLDNLELANLFTKGSHHRCISVIFLQQALFNKGKFSRLCSLNCHYMVVFKSPRDQTVISTLARQMYPGCGQYLIEAYKDATEGAYSYLLIDLHPQTEDKYRLRAKIFPDERQVFYVKK
jgi:ABC-type dipeptide/oligopeptide/nickel transport system ATPase component